MVTDTDYLPLIITRVWRQDSVVMIWTQLEDAGPRIAYAVLHGWN